MSAADRAVPATEVDPRVSVVIPCHATERWPRLAAAVASVQAQQPLPALIVVVVDGNPALYERAHRDLPGVTVVANESARGAAGARNTGVRYTATPYVALLDDDARARPGWLAALTTAVAAVDVVGAGGRTEPEWEADRPVWYPDDLLWAVGATFPDAPSVATPVRNVWSVTMIVRREAFEAAGGFQVEFSKVDDRSRPEDTDLCLRMSGSGGRWVYTPDAVVDHWVPAGRARVGYLLRRGYAEGRGKVCLARRHRGAATLGLERTYLSDRLPRAVARALGDALRRRGRAGARRAAVLLLATAAAGLGAAVELLRGAAPVDGPRAGAEPVDRPRTSAESVLGARTGGATVRGVGADESAGPGAAPAIRPTAVPALGAPTAVAHTGGPS